MNNLMRNTKICNICHSMVQKNHIKTPETLINTGFYIAVGGGNDYK